MSITPSTSWEFRTTGNIQNGAGFDAAFGGTDYSQQDSPQLSVTDATFSTGSTTVTSTGGGFTAAMVGNTMWFGAVAATHGWRQITAFVSSTQVTIDSNAPGTQTGDGFLKVGGANKVSNSGLGVPFVAGNKIWVKAGTYTLTSNSPTITAGSVTQPVTVEGYNTTRGDITTDPSLQRPVFAYGANTINLFKFNGTGGICRAIEFDNRTNATGQAAVVFVDPSAVNCVMENCVIRGMTAGGGLESVTVTGFRNTFRRNYVITGATTCDGMFLGGTGGSHAVVENHLTGGASPNSGSGITVDVGHHTIRNNIIQKFTSGVLVSSATLYAAHVQNNAFHRCTHGINLTNAGQGLVALPHLKGNIFSRLTNGVRYSPADISANTGAVQWAATNWDCNFFFTVTDSTNQLPAGNGDTTLTVDPFVDEANSDFTLNTTSGGGLTVRDSVCSALLPDGINTVHFTGGFDSSPTASSSATSYTAGMRSLWREATGEKYTTKVSDDTVDIYLDYGLQELNRILHYHLITDGGGVTLIAGTQSYDLTQDTVEVLEVYHNGVRLEKTSIDKLETRDRNWRNEAASFPKQWIHDAGSLILVPKPSDAAVAASSTLTIRRVNTPRAITTYGPEQLPTSEHRLSVMYGAYLWSASYPDSALAEARRQGYLEAFRMSVEAVKADYASRFVSR